MLVFAQKVISKAEGRLIELASVTPGEKALELANTVQKDPRLVELILRESRRIVRAAPDVLIVEHRLGLIMANAGIDQSNVAESATRDCALLLPVDPDASAMRLRERLGCSSVVRGRCHHQPTASADPGAWGRWAWRSVAPAWRATLDLRGQRDLFGRALRVTIVGHADEIAAAASILMGQVGRGTPGDPGASALSARTARTSRPRRCCGRRARICSDERSRRWRCAAGVGGAKLAHGLAMALPPQELSVIVNTGDDFRHLGLYICPDLDSVLYALAGLADPVRGWGGAMRPGHSWRR